MKDITELTFKINDFLHKEILSVTDPSVWNTCQILVNGNVWVQGTLYATEVIASEVKDHLGGCREVVAEFTVDSTSPYPAKTTNPYDKVPFTAKEVGL